jgi:hypothetical protein
MLVMKGPQPAQVVRRLLVKSTLKPFSECVLTATSAPRNASDPAMFTFTTMFEPVAPETTTPPVGRIQLVTVPGSIQTVPVAAWASGMDIAGSARIAARTRNGIAMIFFNFLAPKFSISTP